MILLDVAAQDVKWLPEDQQMTEAEEAEFQVRFGFGSITDSTHHQGFRNRTALVPVKLCPRNGGDQWKLGLRKLILGSARTVAVSTTRRSQENHLLNRHCGAVCRSKM